MWNSSVKLIIIFVFVSISTISSQDIEVYYKVKGDSIVFRWLPLDINNWQEGIYSGYQIFLRNQAGINIVDTIIYNELDFYQNESESFSTLYGLAYNKELLEDFIENNPDSLIVNEFNDTIIYEAFNLLASRDRNLLEKSGLIFTTEFNKNRTYEFTISTNQSRKVSDFLIIPREYTSPNVPTLLSKWKNKKVELSWSTKGTKKDYLFYNLYFSNDGDKWDKIDSLYANFYEETDHESLLTINPIKQLPHNDSIYYFKIHGVDFFGEESEDFSLVRGSGSKGIQVSPYWKKVKQLRTNEAEMKWAIPDKSASEVEEFRIYVAETYDGPYFPDTIGISSETRELKREIPFRSAYFRVVAVDKNNDEFSSFPQLVIGVDTLAPAIPKNLSYTIDTTGKLDIKWDPNDEEDFIGYKLFYCYDTTVDMTLAHNSYLVIPEFTDTLELRSTNSKVYYKAISVDKRNNRSDFSEILVVTRPDILPPVEPVFISAEAGPGSATLTWYKSISKDVKEQRLFRRKMNEETSWELLEIWDYSMDTSYIDLNLEAFEKYAYTITVIDSSENESDPSRPVLVMPRPDYRGFDLENWDITLEGDQVKITHGFQPSDFEKIFIYRKIDNEKLFSVGELTYKELIFIDEKIQKSKNYNYAIKVMFKEGIETPLSNYKEIRR